jgi:pyruvate,orthophosphate dikinase
MRLRIASLKEANPMLRHRGCRLGICYPEITQMQVRAIFKATANVTRAGINADLEIIVSLTAFPSEKKNQTDIIHSTTQEVISRTGLQIKHKVRTMIEIQHACLCADEIAKEA